MSETKEYPIDRFLQWVTKLVQRDDRGTLAELRCGLSKTMQDRAWEHLIPCCKELSNPSVRAVWCTVGGLAAILIPKNLDSNQPWWKYNFGTTMRILANGKETGERGEKALKSFEPRFRRILSCSDTVLLCEMVASIGKVAENKGIKINLRGLFWDLSHWEGDSHNDIRFRWSLQFFGCTSSDRTPEVEDKERYE